MQAHWKNASGMHAIGFPTANDFSRTLLPSKIPASMIVVASWRVSRARLELGRLFSFRVWGERASLGTFHWSVSQDRRTREGKRRRKGRARERGEKKGEARRIGEMRAWSLLENTLEQIASRLTPSGRRSRAELTPHARGPATLSIQRWRWRRPRGMKPSTREIPPSPPRRPSSLTPTCLPERAAATPSHPSAASSRPHPPRLSSPRSTSAASTPHSLFRAEFAPSFTESHLFVLII